ncbi:MAG: VWA domain-containing protein, partial [Bdellovibrionaceae bacterium]|nr:VWA domain-containing protein [Pseudobdellovibrionaceae bacterium]
DILFVVDDSGSMAPHQANLTRNIDRFVTQFVNSTQIDFRIGVLTTSMAPFSSARECCGTLVGTPNFVDRRTPMLETVLSRNLRVGTSGDGTEMMFDPVYAALTPPLVNTVNAGFYRKDASLAIVYLTDAEDQSRRLGPIDFYNFLVQEKGKAEKVLAYAVYIPSGKTDNSSCPRDDWNEPARLEVFLNQVVNAGNNTFYLCDPSFGDKLADLGKDLVRRVGNKFYLSRPPIPGSIVVSYGSQIIPNDPKKGWTFDPSLNAVLLGDEIEWSNQPPGTKVKVVYKATDFKVGN